MKAPKKILGIILLSGTLLSAMPVMAQDTGSNAATTATTDGTSENHDDSGKWGLLGLLGLVGLLGLRKKDDNHIHTTSNR